MNISTMIEQLATYRDEIVNILQSLDGLNIDIGTKIDELEKERDENNRKGGSIPPEEFSTKHYTDSLTKDHKDDIKKDKEYNESTKRAFYKGIQ